MKSSRNENPSNRYRHLERSITFFLYVVVAITIIVTLCALTPEIIKKIRTDALLDAAAIVYCVVVVSSVMLFIRPFPWPNPIPDPPVPENPEEERDKKN